MATNLLLLEESLLVQRVAELAFRGRRIHVHAAESADAALTMAETTPLDAFVVSVDMERSDGLAFCRRLRERPEFSRTPLLILTSARRALSDAEIAEVGAAGRVEKPFRPETFTWEVERLIAGGGAAPAPGDWEREGSDSLEEAMIEEILEESPPPAAGAAERPGPPPPEESRPEAKDPAGGKEEPPALDAAALAPAIRKLLEENIEKAVPALLGRVEAVVVARLPDLMERIVLREIEKIKRGE